MRSLVAVVLVSFALAAGEDGVKPSEGESKASPGSIGVSALQLKDLSASPLPEEAKAQLEKLIADAGLTGKHGLMLQRIQPNSPADKARLQVGDFLIGMNGQEFLDEAEGMLSALRALRAGEKATLIYIRGDKKAEAVVVATDQATIKKEASKPRKGDPLPLEIDFEKDEAGAAAPGWKADSFKVVAIPGGGLGFGHDQPVEGGELHKAIFTDAKYEDAFYNTRVQVIGGQNAGAGIISHAKDAKNYYLTLFDASKQTVGFYHVVNGNRQELKSGNAAIQKGQWHELNVQKTRARLIVRLDRQIVLDLRDPELMKAKGRFGLAIPGDSQTVFDQIQVQPAQVPMAGS